MAYVEYSSNNSGGRWWLEDHQWLTLEKAGWVVAWNRLAYRYDSKGNYLYDERGLPSFEPIEGSKGDFKFAQKDDKGDYRWLGGLAKAAFKPDCSDIRLAAEEWARITGACPTDAGCPCCGNPHTFTAYDDNGKYLESGPSTNYSASF